ncbi:MAG: thiamine-phosphate kinase [Planctomycetota bacterium]|jgi:thiamine-monophosphate kinase
MTDPHDKSDRCRSRVENHGHELEFVDWISRQSITQPFVKMGAGDDMATLVSPSTDILIASDMLLDGVHFQTQEHAWPDIGHKAVACCLSDCAAMAVKPLAATLSVAYSHGMTVDELKGIWTGASALCAAFDASIVGGDTTSWCHPLVIDVGIMATPFSGCRPISRGGAIPGDRLFVTGKLGGSIHGKHMMFTPRVREAEVLVRALGDQLHAMIDITDGLALDLHRVCRASGVGASITEDAVKRVASAAAVQEAAGDDRLLIESVLSDGEDFELLFAVAAHGSLPDDLELFEIGEVTGKSVTISTESGDVLPLSAKGFEH